MPLACDAIIFDLDGVLVDSNGIAERHLRAWTERHDVPFERIAAIHHGRTTVETIRLVAPHLDAEAEASLLEGAVRRPAGAEKLSQDRLETTLREMAALSHKIPVLPDEAFTRESLYRDHD